MTIWQILALVILGPIELILIGKFIQAVIAKNRKGFDLIQGAVLFLCICGTIIAFVGLKL